VVQNRSRPDPSSTSHTDCKAFDKHSQSQLHWHNHVGQGSFYYYLTATLGSPYLAQGQSWSPQLPPWPGCIGLEVPVTTTAYHLNFGPRCAGFSLPNTTQSPTESTRCDVSFLYRCSTFFQLGSGNTLLASLLVSRPRAMVSCGGKWCHVAGLL
jgi:hypothetical protein